jgi:hypothetical protein
MTIDRRVLAGSLGLALLLAACGGGASATKAPESAAPASQAAQPTQAAETAEASEEATEQPAESSGVEPSLVPGAAGDLEAMLPAEVNGVKFSKTSFDGASLGAAGMGVNSGDLEPLLKKYGKTISDVRVAIAAPADTTAGSTAMILALQVKGVPAADLIGATGQDTSSLAKKNIGGKDVLTAGAGGFNVAIYTKDDVVFEVLLADATLTEAILKQLP